MLKSFGFLCGFRWVSWKVGRSWPWMCPSTAIPETPWISHYLWVPSAVALPSNHLPPTSLTSPRFTCGGHGARPVPHGELVQCGKRARPRIPVPHQLAIQHSLQGFRGPSGHAGLGELDNRCGPEPRVADGEGATAEPLLGRRFNSVQPGPGETHPGQMLGWMPSAIWVQGAAGCCRAL